MKGIVFIQILDDAIDPVKAVKYIFRRAIESNTPPARFAARIIPIQHTCYAHLEDVVSLLKDMISSAFDDSVKGKSVRLSVCCHVVVLLHKASEQQLLRQGRTCAIGCATDRF